MRSDELERLNFLERIFKTDQAQAFLKELNRVAWKNECIVVRFNMREIQAVHYESSADADSEINDVRLEIQWP